MDQKSDEAYETEKKRVTKYHNLLEIPVLIFLFAGVIAAALDLSIGGFTPVVWFLLSFWCVLVIICMEVTMTRTALEHKE
ncbi:hypothetical protein E2P30_01950 [Candidatus Bathyarchaeota archaeon]|nr:hypothetical protein E2P30_01950 [Candidatus Bathyarchaeota archaeon]